MLIPSSSGYGGLAATPLNQIGYHNEIIARMYERDFLPEITNTNIDERITKCNQTVQFLRAPEVGPWRPYNPNQQMVASRLSVEAFCVQVNNAAYNALKFDTTDIIYACDRWSQWEDAFLDRMYTRWTEMMRSWTLSMMALEAHPRNKGRQAGKFGNIDLGGAGNPVVVNKSNVALRLAELRQVLVDQQIWRENEMFIVLPSQFNLVLIQSDYANASWTGTCRSCSLGIDGMWDTQLAGFNVIESNHVPYSPPQNGTVGFYVIAGHRDAYALVSDIIDGRLAKMDHTFGVEYQLLATWGGKAFYPEALATAYWTFQLT